MLEPVATTKRKAPHTEGFRGAENTEVGVKWPRVESSVEPPVVVSNFYGKRDVYALGKENAGDCHCFDTAHTW